MCRARSNSLSSSTASNAATDAAQATGLPP